MNTLKLKQVEFPKSETFIVKEKTNSLNGIYNVEVHFRNYVGYLDTVDYIILTGDINAYRNIKVDFRYDYTMCKIKNSYTDEFGRIIKVQKVNYKR